MLREWFELGCRFGTCVRKPAFQEGGDKVPGMTTRGLLPDDAPSNFGSRAAHPSAWKQDVFVRTHKVYPPWQQSCNPGHSIREKPPRPVIPGGVHSGPASPSAARTNQLAFPPSLASYGDAQLMSKRLGWQTAFNDNAATRHLASLSPIWILRRFARWRPRATTTPLATPRQPPALCG